MSRCDECDVVDEAWCNDTGGINCPSQKKYLEPITCITCAQCERPLKLPQREEGRWYCPDCGVMVYSREILRQGGKCEHCNGTGGGTITTKCFFCHGSGKLQDELCITVNGSWWSGFILEKAFYGKSTWDVTFEDSTTKKPFVAKQDGDWCDPETWGEKNDYPGKKMLENGD